MASVPASQLPLFYQSLVPLSTQFHPNHGLVAQTDLELPAITHAIPLTVDEFAVAQRSFPIIFGVGENPAPLALLSLVDGLNLFLDADGKWQDGAYLPAFVRRYPFMLAKLGPDADGAVAVLRRHVGHRHRRRPEDKLFDGEAQTPTVDRVLDFCGQFEQAVARTRGFMEEMEKLELLTDGEVTIQQPNAEPAVYRGFRMVAEERLQNLRGDQARKMVQTGMMGLIYAHLFSLPQITTLFERQQMRDAALATA